MTPWRRRPRPLGTPQLPWCHPISPQGRWPQPGAAPLTPCPPSLHGAAYKTNTTGPYRQILYGFHGLRKGWERSYKIKLVPVTARSHLLAARCAGLTRTLWYWDQLGSTGRTGMANWAGVSGWMPAPSPPGTNHPRPAGLRSPSDPAGSQE